MKWTKSNMGKLWKCLHCCKPRDYIEVKIQVFLFNVRFLLCCAPLFLFMASRGILLAYQIRNTWRMPSDGKSRHTRKIQKKVPSRHQRYKNWFIVWFAFLYFLRCTYPSRLVNTFISIYRMSLIISKLVTMPPHQCNKNTKNIINCYDLEVMIFRTQHEKKRNK